MNQIADEPSSLDSRINDAGVVCLNFQFVIANSVRHLGVIPLDGPTSSCHRGEFKRQQRRNDHDAASSASVGWPFRLDLLF